MSKVKGAGAVSMTKNMEGKRLGVKKFGGETVVIGNIIVKQRGTVYHVGKNVKIGRDHTIYAVADGVVAFRRMSGYKRSRYYVDVVTK
ncbi:50S ribosomal protein L27 [bacterium]|nr:50S ribosomal protein L27 [bacterium]